MSRKTKIVLAITFMVAVLVSYFSYLYISEILRQAITNAHEIADQLTNHVAYLADNAVPDLASTKINTRDPEAVRRAVAYYLSTDEDLNVALESMVSNFLYVYDASIVDANGKVILHTDPDLIGKQVSDRPEFRLLENARFRRQLRMVYNPPTVYEIRMPLRLNGTPFGTIRLGISTIFLRNQLTPRLRAAVAISGIAIVLSLILAAGLSHLALGPLARLSRSLDSVSAGTGAPLSEESTSKDEYGLVSQKIAHLGQQMRDAKEIFSALKDNVDQIMANLQDGLMLFTRDSRVVLVSASVERFMGRPRGELLGRTVEEIFFPDSALGALVLDGFSLRHPIAQTELESLNGQRVQVSLDFIQERGTPIGALLTLRDAESVRRIEDEIELSRRMSASGRLTRGVAHEVKNPINAIVLHLQVLQTKMQDLDPDTRRHMDVIDRELHRLDRVIQILVDFTRPRDLHLEEIDLRRVLDEVAQLASPGAERHGVAITRDFPSEPLNVRVDVDFMKQAILNVVLNGVQAMPQGGTLSLVAHGEDHASIVTEIRDEGSGIPTEIQEKIFELYFTTKQDGSGIGLAQTYQIMQWHYGSVDFQSLAGQGTTFHLRLPTAESRPEANAINGQSIPQTLPTPGD
jgi:signal transduction histidine kinase